MTKVIGSDGAVDLMEASDDNTAWLTIGGRAAVEADFWGNPNGVTIEVKTLYPQAHPEPEAWQIVLNKYQTGDYIHLRWTRRGKKYRTPAGTGAIVTHDPQFEIDQVRRFFVHMGYIEDW